jgi:hypothetical protein
MKEKLIIDKGFPYISFVFSHQTNDFCIEIDHLNEKELVEKIFLNKSEVEQLKIFIDKFLQK